MNCCRLARGSSIDIRCIRKTAAFVHKRSLTLSFSVCTPAMLLDARVEGTISGSMSTKIGGDMDGVVGNSFRFSFSFVNRSDDGSSLGYLGNGSCVVSSGSVYAKSGGGADTSSISTSRIS